jgi:hypothetical protein
MTKIAVGLFGIHYLQDLNHWCFGKHMVDYRKTYENCKNNIYNLLGSDVSIDYFSATYDSAIYQELLKDYNFRRIQFNEVDNSTAIHDDEKFIRRNKIFKKTIELMIDPEYDYDFALITRYDMRMKVKINSLSFDFDKVNVFYKAKWNGYDEELIDDNFYYMPYNKLQDFYNKMLTIPENITSHLWGKYLTDLHMVVDGSYYSHESPVYNINRCQGENI